MPNMYKIWEIGGAGAQILRAALRSTVWRSAAASAPTKPFKIRTISRAKLVRCKHARLGAVWNRHPSSLSSHRIMTAPYRIYRQVFLVARHTQSCYGGNLPALKEFL